MLDTPICNRPFVGKRDKVFMDGVPSSVKKWLINAYQNDGCSQKSILLSFLEFITVKFSKLFYIREILYPLNYFALPFVKVNAFETLFWLHTFL